MIDKNDIEFGKVHIWQERLQRNMDAYRKELEKFKQRDALYDGDRSIRRNVNSTSTANKMDSADFVRNICAEIIEAEVDSSIPQPKITARYESDEKLATTIEEFLKNELDRLPFEELNDIDERITPIHGGNIFLVEWDSDRHTHSTVGELCVSTLHPKQVIFQDGVANVEDMDYIFIQLAQTKAYIKSKYGIDVSEEGEENSSIRGGNSFNKDIVTMNTAYYRNQKGGIGKFSWVNDIVIEDLEDYQARQLEKCISCGAIRHGNDEECSECGGKGFKNVNEDTFTLEEAIAKSDGTVIEPYEYNNNMAENMDFGGAYENYSKPLEIPYYKPDVYPIIVRRNVSKFGVVLGDSDIDKIADQQNAIKKTDTRIIEKLDKGGSLMTIGADTKLEFNDEQLKIVRIENPAEASLIQIKNLQVDTSADLQSNEYWYQSARNIIGITDSFQGRKDSSANSGKAKEIAAAQTAGRLESRKIMKNLAYSKIFEVMFKFLLAYADEPRPAVKVNSKGQKEYFVFNKFDFLEKDSAGEWYWNDEFLFSVDTSAALSKNREAMWQETRQNLQDGAFGDRADIRTLIEFWTKMELLHYPGAGNTKEFLEERLSEQKQEEQEQKALEEQQRAMQGQMNIPSGDSGSLADDILVNGGNENVV